MAAKLRDEISKLEAESLTASIRAQAYVNVEYAFRLGQKVRHKNFGMEALTKVLFCTLMFYHLGEVAADTCLWHGYPKLLSVGNVSLC